MYVDPETQTQGNDEEYTPKQSSKQSNVLQLWGNERSMNLNPLILTNIQSSHYFKGFMYIRYVLPPGHLLDWYEPYLEDEEELDVKAGGGQMMRIGMMLRQWLVKLEWFSTLFPRIPVPIQQKIQRHLEDRFPIQIHTNVREDVRPNRNEWPKNNEREREWKEEERRDDRDKERYNRERPRVDRYRMERRERTPEARRDRDRDRKHRDRSPVRERSKERSHGSRDQRHKRAYR